MASHDTLHCCRIGRVATARSLQMPPAECGRSARGYQNTGGPTDMAEFSPELLRTARELSGLSARELAERAGLNRVTIANYERGMHCPAGTWQRIEKALRHALDEHTRAVEKV